MSENQDPTLQRKHIYEIDLIRAITVFSVVTIHALISTQFLVTKDTSIYFTNLVIHLLQYNRQMFMFMTGLVLTYAYFGKPFSIKRFYKRRVIFILIPYLLWSAVYIKLNNFSFNIPQYFDTFWRVSLTGEASYQLYYILLALEFYLIFPLFLLFLKKVSHHPWITLSISLLLQLIFMFIDFTYFQSGEVSSSFISQIILPYQERIIFTYQFFFIFGAFAAIYMQQGYETLKKYGKFLPFLLIMTLVLFCFYYYYLITIRPGDIFYATSAIQPSVVLYSCVMIIFYFWLATLWAKKLTLYSWIKTISETSFGIYFVHVYIISLVIDHVLPSLGGTPVVLEMLFVVLSTFAISVGFCFLLLKTPFLSWTIGKENKSKKL